MTNEAFARVKNDALLAAPGWSNRDPNAVRYEVMLPDNTRADYVLCGRRGRSLAIEEQCVFSRPAEAARSIRSQQEMALTKAGAIFDALLSRAFG